MKKRIYYIFLLFLWIDFFFNFSYSQTIEKFQTPGSYTWTCPDSINIIKVQCWGGGGPGGHGGYGLSGYGGGGGGYSESFFFVKPKSYYFLRVGKGGVPTPSYDNWPAAKPGEDSWFNINNNIPSDNLKGILAQGAFISGGYGNKYKGGNGSYPYQYNYRGVGGASSASEYGNGIDSDSKSEIGRIAPINGGQGGGGFPGGGGSGAKNDHTQSGGIGGNGQVIISTLKNCDFISPGLVVEMVKKNSCGGNIEIKSTNYKFQNGLQYIWQFSQDSLNWFNLTQYDNDSIINYNVTKPLNYFRIKTVCKFTKDSIYSNIVNHQIYDDTLFKGSISINQRKCQGDYVDDITIKDFKGNIQWQSSYDQINWSDVLDQNKDTLKGNDIPTAEKTTYFRAKLSSIHCGVIYSDVVKIDVQEKYKTVDIIREDNQKTNQYLCLGQKFSTLKIINNINSYFDSNDKFQWQFSNDNINFTNKIGENSLQLSNSINDTLKKTTFFRCIVERSVCKADTSFVYKIKVNDKPTVPGIISSDQILCYNSKISTLKILGHEGNQFSWFYGTNIYSIGNYLTYDKYKDYIDNNDLKINSLLSTNSWFCKAYVIDSTNACGGSFTNIISIQREAPISVGTITSTSTLQNICKGSLLYTDLTLSSFSGDSIIWQKSIDSQNWQKINPFSGLSKLTQNQVGNLDTTTFFRAEIKRKGVCESRFSNVLVQNVLTPPVAGKIITTLDTICSGNTPKPLSLKNYKTNLGLQWQYLNKNNFWVNISGNQTDSLTGTQLGKITSTTSIRVQVRGAACNDVYTDVVQIPVSPLSVAGTISSNQLICSGTYPTDLSISGGTGKITWQKSTNTTLWTNIPNSIGGILSSKNAGIVNEPTYYRGVQTSVNCPSVFTSMMTVNIDSLSYAGIPSSNQSLCVGTNSGAISVLKPRGTIQWQSSTDGYNYTNIVNASALTYQPGLLSSTTYYRLKATNGICPTVYSSPIQIEIAPKSIVGTLSANQTICSGTQPSTITLNNANGTISWQSSLDNSAWSTIPNVSGTTLNGTSIGQLSSSKYFRAVVKSGACTGVNSNSIYIGIRSNPIVSAGSNKSICPNTSITLNGTGASTYSWSSSITNGIPFTPTNTTTYSVTGTDIYGCKGNSQVTITVFAQPTVQISNNTSGIICQGTPFTLSSSTNNASFYQWKLNGFYLNGATNNYLLSKIAGNYSLEVQSINGCKVESTPITIQTQQLTNINAGSDQTICLGDKIKLDATCQTLVDWGQNLKNGDFVSPTKDTLLIASTTDQNSCQNSDTLNVKVNYPSNSIVNTTSFGSFELNGKTYNETGQYIQTIKNSYGCDSTITLNLVIENLGINENEIEGIKVYPNPTSDGIIQIESVYDINSIKLYNSDGKLLESSKDKTIDLSRFGRGLYFITLFDENSNMINYKIVY
jgi:hypothetical protein